MGMDLLEWYLQLGNVICKPCKLDNYQTVFWSSIDPRLQKRLCSNTYMKQEEQFVHNSLGKSSVHNVYGNSIQVSSKQEAWPWKIPAHLNYIKLLNTRQAKFKTPDKLMPFWLTMCPVKGELCPRLQGSEQSASKYSSWKTNLKFSMAAQFLMKPNHHLSLKTRPKSFQLIQSSSWGGILYSTKLDKMSALKQNPGTRCFTLVRTSL